MKTTIRLYDSYEGKLREFVPLEGNEVDIYYCGPTVYNYVHLGNFRPTITFDLLTRFLKEGGIRCPLRLQLYRHRRQDNPGKHQGRKERKGTEPILYPSL